LNNISGCFFGGLLQVDFWARSTLEKTTLFLFSSGRESVGLSPAFGFCLSKLFSDLKWQTVEGQSPKMVFHVFFPGVVWRFIVWCGFSRLSRGFSRFWHAPGGKK
jgi:hypothetical protein